MPTATSCRSNSPSRDREFVGDTSYAGHRRSQAHAHRRGDHLRRHERPQRRHLAERRHGQDLAVDAAPARRPAWSSTRTSGAVLNPATGTYRAGQPPGRLRRHPRRGRLHEPQPGPGLEPDARRHRQPADLQHCTSTEPNVNPVNGPTPNGAEGRITWPCPPRPATPPRTPSTKAGSTLVATPAGALDGIFVTKDFGQNWTEVSIPTEPNEGYQTNPAIPTNDVSLTDYPIIGSASSRRAITTMPSPSTPPIPASFTWAVPSDGNQSGLIRIDLTDIWDAHALVAYSTVPMTAGR